MSREKGNLCMSGSQLILILNFDYAYNRYFVNLNIIIILYIILFLVQIPNKLCKTSYRITKQMIQM